MRGQHQRTLVAVEQFGVAVECVETISVDDHRCFGLANGFVDELHRFTIAANAWADCHHGDWLHQLLETAALDGGQCNATAFGFSQRLGHQLRSECGDAGEHPRGRCDGAESCPGAQSCHARHGGGSGLAHRSARRSRASW